MRRRFGKPEALHTRRDFLRVQNNATRFRRAHMVLLVAQGEEGTARVGYTVSRKVGNAVVRNRVRRRLKEIIRTHPELLSQGIDHVIVAYHSAATADFGTLEEELTWLLQRARAQVSGQPSSSP